MKTCDGCGKPMENGETFMHCGSEGTFGPCCVSYTVATVAHDALKCSDCGHVMSVDEGSRIGGEREFRCPVCGEGTRFVDCIVDQNDEEIEDDRSHPDDVHPNRAGYLPGRGE